MAETYIRLDRPAIPKEQLGNAIYGSIMHLGSPALFVVFLAVFGVTLTSTFLSFMAVSAIFTPLTLWEEKRNASVKLPAPTPKEWWDGMGMVFIKGIAIGGGFVTVGWWALKHISPYPALSNSWWLIALATIGTDFAYYLIHRLVSHGSGDGAIVRYYRKKHGAHHSVTELDFLRGNQSSIADTAFTQFQPSLIVLSYVMGMDLPATWAAYFLILALQATDHTSVTYNIGWLKYIFMDNHAHKLHHCRRGNLVNHAAAFSVFDRFFGTYYEDWELSSNHLHHHNIALPIRALRGESKTGYALITGASSGIGLAMARQMAERGYGLILVARRKDRLDTLKEELEKLHSVKVVVLAQDLAEPDAAQKLVEATRIFKVDVLINNAGYGMQGKFLSMDLEAVEKMFRVNMVSLTQLTQLFAKEMVKRQGGYILNVASAAAFLPSPYVSAYAATKAYVLHFSEALSFELQGTGVSVSTLYPGITTTEFNEVAEAKTPGFMAPSILGAQEVAEIGLAGMFGRKTAIIPGKINKLNAFFSHVAPRRLVTWAAGSALAKANGW